MTDKIVVFSTCADAAEAEALAKRLVEKRLAACVSIVPQARSIYRWKGQVEDSAECLLIIKSRRGLFDRLSAEISNAHSYDVPEIIATSIVEGAPAYLRWLERELSHEA